MAPRWIKRLFIVAGVYDSILGMAFFLQPSQIFEWFGILPPEQMMYVQFPALLTLIFAAMFFKIASDPLRNRQLILYGCGLMLSFSAIVFWYELTEEISFIWIPWAWLDFVFFLLFVLAWRTLGKLMLSD